MVFSEARLDRLKKAMHLKVHVRRELVGDNFFYDETFELSGCSWLGCSHPAPRTWRRVPGWIASGTLAGCLGGWTVMSGRKTSTNFCRKDVGTGSSSQHFGAEARISRRISVAMTGAWPVHSRWLTNLCGMDIGTAIALQCSFWHSTENCPF